MQLPIEVSCSGAEDAVHLIHAISEGRVCLTGNHRHFSNLHVLVMKAGGHHPGIFVVRKDNDPTRDMTPNGIVRAIRTLLNAKVPVQDQITVLNLWR